MFVYNVTSQLTEDIEQSWLQWMQEVHIPEMIATEQFTAAKILKIQHSENPDSVSYAVQYSYLSPTHIQTYLDTYASKLRQAAKDAFGEKVLSFRTFLEEISTY